jgi:hypothetical protein
MGVWTSKDSKLDLKMDLGLLIPPLWNLINEYTEEQQWWFDDQPIARFCVSNFVDVNICLALESGWLNLDQLIVKLKKIMVLTSEELSSESIKNHIQLLTERGFIHTRSTRALP